MTDKDYKEFDWVKDDPCYGCKHAKRLKDDEVNGMFGRRFGCTRLGRISGVKSAAVRSIEHDELREAAELVSLARDMRCDFVRKGYFECSGSIAPACFERDDEMKKEEP